MRRWLEGAFTMIDNGHFELAEQLLTPAAGTWRGEAGLFWIEQKRRLLAAPSAGPA